MLKSPITRIYAEKLCLFVHSSVTIDNIFYTKMLKSAVVAPVELASCAASIARIVVKGYFYDACLRGGSFMSEQESETPGDADDKPKPLGETFGLRTALKGAVGITKAALHVDRAPEVLIRKRRSICAICPQANAGSSRTSRCLACTCFIHPKTATATEKCPLSRW